MEHLFRIAEIELSKSSLNENLIGIFRYESETKHQRGSTLLILAEIGSTLYLYERLLDVLNEAAERSRRLISGFEGDPIARFEKFIQLLNEALARFLQDEPTPLAWNRVNLFVVELSDGHACLSGIGRLYNVFFQKQEDGSFRKFDLLGSLEQPTEVDPQKPFASLLCGDVHPGDLLFIGTSNFERLREELELSKKITHLPAVSAALEIRQALERQNIPDDFAGVIISSVHTPVSSLLAETKKEPLAVDQRPESTRSIEKMHQEEEKTAAMLSPVITPFASKDKDQKDGAEPLWKRLPLALLKQGKTFLKTRTKRIQDPVALAGLRSLSAGHGGFMNKKRKLSLIFVGMALVVLVGGTVWYRVAKRAEAEQTLWNLSYNQAVDKKNRAEADLVYNNEDRARGLLTEANTILNSLDEKTSKRKTAKADLSKGLDDLRQKLKHEQHLDHPTEIATEETGWKSTVALTDGVYGLTGDGASVIKIDPRTHEQKHLSLTTASSSPIGLLLLKNNKNDLLVLTDKQELLMLNTKRDGFTSVPFSLGKSGILSSATIYNRRLYALDPSGNMIWKFAVNGNGFGTPTAYLKQNTENLTDAVSLTIDANVYVGFKNGKVARYLSGAEEVWAPITIDPPLSNVTSLWTHPDTDRVVVVDGVGQRVIIFRKDGALISQLVSPEFQHLGSIDGDPIRKQLYLIDGKRLLSLDLP